MMNLADELLTVAADRDLPRLDEKLYLDVFSAGSPQAQTAQTMKEMRAMRRSPVVSFPVSEPPRAHRRDAPLPHPSPPRQAPGALRAPRDSTELRPPPGTRAAHHIIVAVREVHAAIDVYTAAIPDTILTGAADDEIPFSPSPVSRAEGGPSAHDPPP